MFVDSKFEEYTDNMNKHKLSKGFTLVELLVVIAIIGILATLLLLQLNVARSKARDTKRVGDVNQIRTAVEEFYDDCNEYPTDIYNAGTDCGGGIGKYMSSGAAPDDPQGNPYGYGINGDNTKYQVWIELENKNANALNNDADINGGYTGGTDGGVEDCTDAAGDCVFDLGIK